jgi:hypothetical protein
MLQMKKLSLLFMLFFLSLSFVAPQTAMASLNPVQTELSVSPASKGLTKKEKRKQMRKLRKKYKKEMRGMSRAEKQQFLEDKLAQSPDDQLINIPNKQYLIIGLVLILIGAIFYLIPGLYWLGGLIQAIGGIILIVWLILLILEM